MATSKESINKLVDLDVKQSRLDEAAKRQVIPQRNVTVRPVSDSESGSGSGLTPPLTMRVDKVKTVNIPVPLGATSVDVDVVQSYTLTDSAGVPVILPVDILDYP